MWAHVLRNVFVDYACYVFIWFVETFVCDKVYVFGIYHITALINWPLVYIFAMHNTLGFIV